MHARFEETIQIDEYSQRSGHTMNTDIDKFYIINYHYNNGFADDKSKIVYPVYTKKILWEIRSNDTDYLKYNRMCIRDYPKQWVETIKDDIKKRKKIEDAAKRGDDTVNPITDIFNSSRNKVIAEDVVESFADMQFGERFHVKDYYDSYTETQPSYDFLTRKRKKDPNHMLIEN